MESTVVMEKMIEELILTGANIVKIGIETRLICTKGKQFGVQYSKLISVLKCANTVYYLNSHVIVNNGCTYHLDMPKTFGLSANFFIHHSMLPGHKKKLDMNCVSFNIFLQEGYHL